MVEPEETASSPDTVVSFESSPDPGVINFGIGQPSSDLLPLDLVRDASDRFFAGAEPSALNYGPLAGDESYLESLSRLLEREYGKAASPDSLFLTTGNSHGLDFACSCFTTPGDTVFIEHPTYFLALRILRDRGLRIVPIPVDGNGLDTDRLELELRRHRPKFLYTIPSYHNPTGCTLSSERRDRLVHLSREQDFLIVADEVYQLLYFNDPPPPALGTCADEGNVLSLGSFSKILAPAMRVGWIQTDERHRQRLAMNGVINSSGSPNHYASHIVRHAIESGSLERHIEGLRRELGRRCSAMDRALSEHIGSRARWHMPQGGYFFWLELDGGIDTAKMRDSAARFATGFQPGAVFSADRDVFQNCLRLSFAHYSVPDIEDGISRLGELVRNVCDA